MQIMYTKGLCETIGKICKISRWYSMMVFDSQYIINEFFSPFFQITGRPKEEKYFLMISSLIFVISFTTYGAVVFD